MVKITGIIKRSAAQAANIMPGDILVSINGHDINDVLDYMYYAAVDRLALILLRNNFLYNMLIDPKEIISFFFL